jgi:roadblock/LC7 domain-containing protein
LGIYSPDGKFVAYPDRNKDVAVVERLADGVRWEINTQQRSLNFTPDSQHVIWTAGDEDTPGDSREATTWIANVDGSNARILPRPRRTDLVTWLSADELLLTRRITGSSEEQFFTLSLTDGSQTELFQAPSVMRGLAFSPNKRFLVYYVSLEKETDKNGVWLLDLFKPAQAPQRLPFFGTYRWADNQRLIYVPLNPDATSHEFYEYDVFTKETQPLFSDGTNLTIANNDWQVSPDGHKIALVAANGTELDGIWVLDINQD